MILPELEKLMKEALVVCASRFSVLPEAILGKSRSIEHVMPRHVLMYVFCDQLVNMGLASLKTVGAFFSKRDHSTVIHARGLVWEAIEKPYVQRDMLIAAAALELCAWMKPRVIEVLNNAGKDHEYIHQAMNFFERVEQLEKDVAVLQRIIADKV